MTDKRNLRRNVSRLTGAIGGIALLLGFIWFVHTMMSAKTSQSVRQVETVQLIRPPPPPPPPPDEPPPPPPEKTDDPLPKDEPEPAPDNTPAPADQPLGLDAEGSAGDDAFGLAARSGGSDLVGGTGRAPFGSYTERVVDAIRDRLAGVACAKAARGSLSVHVILEADGKIKQVLLATTTGNRQVDQCIESALASTPGLGEPLPTGMPEQINLKIFSRN